MERDQYPKEGIDNPGATEDDGSNLRPDLVISVQPQALYGASRAQLPVSTVDWQSVPRGQFIPVSGLDFLIGVNSLLIKQTVEINEMTSKIESENRYVVKIPQGESLYIASEVSTATQRCLCGAGRAFTMHLHDNTRQEALQLQRRLAAASCCFPCRLQIMSPDGLRVAGRIVHGWDRELVSFTTTLHVPASASQPRHKALLLAATFLMEYTHFERAKSTCMRCNCF